MTVVTCVNCGGKGFVYMLGYDGMIRPVTCKGLPGHGLADGEGVVTLTIVAPTLPDYRCDDYPELPDEGEAELRYGGGREASEGEE